jgi:hypothetical protein
MTKKMAQINWLKESQEHDYPAALSYLSLIYDESMTNTYVEKLARRKDSFVD